MVTPALFVSTWSEGLFRVTEKTAVQELADQSVRSLVSDGHGGVFAIIGDHSLSRWSANGEWTQLAKCELALSCCVAIGDIVFVGTDDARIPRAATVA